MSQDDNDICQFCRKESATCFTIFAPWWPRLYHVCAPCAEKGGYKVYADDSVLVSRRGKERLLEETGEIQ